MNVLYLGPADHLELVRELLPGARVCHAADAAAADAALADCQAVLDASMRVRFDAARLARAPRLRLYVTATTGADHVDAAALEARGAPLLTLRGETEVLRDVTAAAEHSWLLLLACCRQLIAAARAVRQGEWRRERFPGAMLRGKTLGIVGCGRIGQWMARYAEAFGMRRLGFDPHLEPWPEIVERAGWNELLASSDAITVHVPLAEDTRGLLDAEAFAAMRPGAIVINTSRGEVIDEAALLAALASGRLAAAGLDVLAGEPEIADHPLVAYAREHDNLIITPHIGGMSPDAVRHVLAFSCRRIAEFFAERA